MTWAKSENTSEIGNRPFAVLSDNLSSPCRYHLSEACRYLHRCCFAEHLNIGDAIVCSTQHCTATRALYKYTEYEKTRRPPITNGKNLFNPFADMFTSNMTLLYLWFEHVAAYICLHYVRLYYVCLYCVCLYYVCLYYVCLYCVCLYGVCLYCVCLYGVVILVITVADCPCRVFNLYCNSCRLSLQSFQEFLSVKVMCSRYK